MSTYLYRLARWCFRHRRRVLSAWLLAVVVVVVLSVLGHGTENNNITIPGTESQQVVDLLEAKIPAFSGAQTQVVFASNGQQKVTSAPYAAGIQKTIKQMESVPQVAEVKDPILNRSISPDGKVALATVLWDTPAATRPIVRRKGMPTTLRPHSATMTVAPANTTALPAVPTAVATDSSIGLPASSWDRCLDKMNTP